MRNNSKKVRKNIELWGLVSAAYRSKISEQPRKIFRIRIFKQDGKVDRPIARNRLIASGLCNPAYRELLSWRQEESLYSSSVSPPS